VEAAVAALSEPAHPAKIMARVLALLNPYFDKDTPQAIREIEAEDWAAALGCQPYWAIEKAARWWKSDANPDRRKRPLEGDLVARVKREMDAVNAARFMLAQGVASRSQAEKQPPEPEQERISGDRAAEIMAEVWSTVKKFGH
jgi:hypothetical protein